MAYLIWKVYYVYYEDIPEGVEIKDYLTPEKYLGPFSTFEKAKEVMDTLVEGHNFRFCIKPIA